MRTERRPGSRGPATNNNKVSSNNNSNISSSNNNSRSINVNNVSSNDNVGRRPGSRRPVALFALS